MWNVPWFEYDPSVAGGYGCGYFEPYKKNHECLFWK